MNGYTVTVITMGAIAIIILCAGAYLLKQEVRRCDAAAMKVGARAEYIREFGCVWIMPDGSLRRPQYP